jgi:hypothetical protein
MIQLKYVSRDACSRCDRSRSRNSRTSNLHPRDAADKESAHRRTRHEHAGKHKEHRRRSWAPGYSNDDDSSRRRADREERRRTRSPRRSHHNRYDDQNPMDDERPRESDQLFDEDEYGTQDELEGYDNESVGYGVERGYIRQRPRSTINDGSRDGKYQEPQYTTPWAPEHQSESTRSPELGDLSGPQLVHVTTPSRPTSRLSSMETLKQSMTLTDPDPASPDQKQFGTPPPGLPGENVAFAPQSGLSRLSSKRVAHGDPRPHEVKPAKISDSTQIPQVTSALQGLRLQLHHANTTRSDHREDQTGGLQRGIKRQNTLSRSKSVGATTHHTFRDEEGARHGHDIVVSAPTQDEEKGVRSVSTGPEFRVSNFSSRRIPHAHGDTHSRPRNQIFTKDLVSGSMATLPSFSPLPVSPSSISASGSHGFQYRPLDEMQFRLVRILPKSMVKLQCEIAHWSLLDPPAYVAISYAWGDGLDTEPLELGGVTIPVGKSLYEALEAVRHGKKDALVWVDALCIDQNNKDERAAQVRLMGHIYSQAVSVAIWLGPEIDDDSVIVTDLLYRISENRISPENIKFDPASEALLALLRRDYWKRLWVRAWI